MRLWRGYLRIERLGGGAWVKGVEEEEERKDEGGTSLARAARCMGDVEDMARHSKRMPFVRQDADFTAACLAVA